MKTRTRRFDVAVIGGGLAGLTAATVAAREGLKVIVVRRGVAATAMASGGLDFPAEMLGLYGPRGAGDAWASPALVAEAAGLLRDWFASAGARLEGVPGETLRLMDTSGEVRTTNLALAQHAAGRVDRWTGGPEGASGGKVLFAGVEGYTPYRPEWVRRKALAAGLVSGQASTAAALLPVPGLEDEANLPAARIAQALEEPGAAETFGRAVAEAARGAGAEFVALPPVLGFERAADVYETVSATVTSAVPGAVVFELLSRPPSLPGQRIQRLLERVAEAAGVRIVPGSVTGPASDPTGGRTLAGGAEAVAAVRVLSHGRPWFLRARAFVLAAGKFAAGGLEARNQVVSEPIFSLPVFAPPPPGWPPGEMAAGGRAVRELIWERFAAGHPIFEVGLAVDEDLHPVGEDGRVAFANLLAAGSIIGGPNPFAEACGSGMAAASGLVAGRTAIRAVRDPAASPPGEPTAAASGRTAGCSAVAGSERGDEE